MSDRPTRSAAIIQDFLAEALKDIGDANEAAAGAVVDSFFNATIDRLMRDRRFAGAFRFEIELLLFDRQAEATLRNHAQIDPDRDAATIVDVLIEHVGENTKDGLAALPPCGWGGATARDWATIRQLWRQAGNAVQWRP